MVSNILIFKTQISVNEGAKIKYHKPDGISKSKHVDRPSGCAKMMARQKASQRMDLGNLRGG